MLELLTIAWVALIFWIGAVVAAVSILIINPIIWIIIVTMVIMKLLKRGCNCERKTKACCEET